MKPGRKPHEPTEKDRRTVEMMAGCGILADDIARVIGITAPTLRKWYPDELATAHIKATSMVAQSLYQKATGTGPGAVVAAIFWLKCRAGWVEPKPWDEQPLGKKELQQQAAATAGAGTAWEDDLKFEGRAN